MNRLRQAEEGEASPPDSGSGEELPPPPTFAYTYEGKPVGAGEMVPIRTGTYNPFLLKIKRLHPSARFPYRATDGSIGYDLALIQELIIQPGERRKVDVGLAMKPPLGHYIRLAGKSKLAEVGLDVVAGVIDSDYTGPIKVMVHHHGATAIILHVGEAICQMILERASVANIEEVNHLPATERCHHGFGMRPQRLQKDGPITEETDQTMGTFRPIPPPRSATVGPKRRSERLEKKGPL